MKTDMARASEISHNAIGLRKRNTNGSINFKELFRLLKDTAAK
jgi:hypothetical protein